jgi:hypothetical protein
VFEGGVLPVVFFISRFHWGRYGPGRSSDHFDNNDENSRLDS